MSQRLKKKKEESIKGSVPVDLCDQQYQLVQRHPERNLVSQWESCHCLVEVDFTCICWEYLLLQYIWSHVSLERIIWSMGVYD